MIHRFVIAGLSGLFFLTGNAAFSEEFANVPEDDSVQLASVEPVGHVQIPSVKSYNVPEKYRPQTVSFSGYKPGTIVIDPKNYFLYLIESPTTARRYGIAVGKIGLQFKGSANIRFKREWPRWIPTKDMVKRSPEHYARFANGMDGGPGNPLGARALYLWQGNKDTYIRIHGTVQPWTIGSSASNGCFRMINDDVLDLYDRVDVGTEVVVL
ncbi:L,D-transpeptidase [uncultured Bartonella sp.]|uniref:L,D-transpeptidase n=1 Tax=uncultured Bartonella sp. TaxID=104108 RepID=UPI00342FFCB9